MSGKEKALEVLAGINAASSDVQWELVRFDEETGRALVLAKDIIAQMPYDLPGGVAITWEKCTIRKWLNKEFYDRLPEAVRAKSVERAVHTPDNCGIPGGGDTMDRVFLLSIDEYEQMPAGLRPALLNGKTPSWSGCALQGTRRRTLPTSFPTATWTAG